MNRTRQFGPLDSWTSKHETTPYGLERFAHKDTGGEYLVGSDIGPPGLQRELRSVVDLGYGAGMSGYVGKMSSTS